VEADLVDENASATDMMEYVKTVIVPKILAKYPTVSVKYEGQNREAQKTQKSAKKVVPVVLFMIVALIVFTFRSFGQTMLLFILIPFSFVGVAWGHWIHGQAISILSMMGIVALIGILVNDGLVLISTYNRFLKQGVPVMDAVYKAGIQRFRAIFLTSVTTVAGLGPLILEKSFQAQFLIPMAISIAYGITIATVLTLLLLPVLLISLNRFKRVLIYLWEGKKVKPEDVEHAIIEIKYENDELDL
jgi:multidrug efflux pump subunit AcrB